MRTMRGVTIKRVPRDDHIRDPGDHVETSRRGVRRPGL